MRSLGYGRARLALSLAIFCAVAGSLVALRTMTVKESYRLVRAQREWKQLYAEVARLQAEWLIAERPERLAEAAKALGLVPLTPGQILTPAPQTRPGSSK